MQLVPFEPEVEILNIVGKNLHIIEKFGPKTIQVANGLSRFSKLVTYPTHDASSPYIPPFIVEKVLF